MGFNPFRPFGPLQNELRDNERINKIRQIVSQGVSVDKCEKYIYVQTGVVPSAKLKEIESLGVSWEPHPVDGEKITLTLKRMDHTRVIRRISWGVDLLVLINLCILFYYILVYLKKS